MVKLNLRNPTLTIAIAVSVAVHAVLLFLRFTSPDFERQKPDDPGLEVILVNAKHAAPPLRAEVLAQANLDGGGNADAGRAKSPLPDLHHTEAGDSVKSTRRRIVDLEQAQQRLMAQMNKPTALSVASLSELEKIHAPQQPDGNDAQDSSRAIARREAEIARNVEDYNKRPKKTQITPSTREVGYAMYYKALQDKIEKVGTTNFPQQNGKKLYGDLVLYIPIYQDGTIYERDGGPRVERSSGNPALDNAALRIVRRSANFGRFPSNMRSADKDDVWEIITRFKFTREESLEAELRGAAN